MKRNRKETLYRKVNKTTVCRTTHDTIKNPNSKYDRGTKNGIKRSMRPLHRTGYDYTPLYRFLLSKVGKDWDEVYSEAKSRLDNEDAIFYMVALHEKDMNDYFRSGESSFHSKLYVDDTNILQYVNPNLKNTDFDPICPCCTHTFNGKVLINKYKVIENNS